mgnify:CR=1 FL=1
MGMLWFVTLTQDCNLACKYCGSDENVDIEDMLPIPRQITYDLEKLAKLRDVEDLVLCFYGGEPLLKIDLILRIIEMLPHAKFVLQTNALNLNKLPTDALLRMDTILVSVDGDSATTNKNRGKNTYEKAIANAREARDRGYRNDMIARMTVGEDSHIYEDVMHLIRLEHQGKALFDHVHWQLNVEFDTPAYHCYDDFFGWRDNEYNPGISRLVDEFIRGLEEGRILGIVPFEGILWSYLSGEKFETVRCGSGWNSFNVATNGDITACPIAPEFTPLENIETIKDAHSLMHHEKVEEPCSECDVLSECGGRCLYCNQTQWWNEEGLLEVCVTIRHLLNEIRERVQPVARRLIEEGKFSQEDFHYPAYNNTTEIIP